MLAIPRKSSHLDSVGVNTWISLGLSSSFSFSMENSVTHVGFTAIPTTSMGEICAGCWAEDGACPAPDPADAEGENPNRTDLAYHHTKRRVRRYITRVVAPLFLYLPSWKGLSLFLCEYGWVPIVPTVYALAEDLQSLLLGSRLQLTIQGYSKHFR